MLVKNFWTNKQTLHITLESGTLKVLKYSYNGYTDEVAADRAGLYGDLGEHKKGVLPIWYLLQKRLTMTVADIPLAGTTMESTHGVNRQDYLAQLKDNGSLANNILYLKHEFDNPYDPMAIAVKTVDNNGRELDLGYLPRFRPNRKTKKFNEDEGDTSNYQKLVVFDQEKQLEQHEYFITGYQVTGGYSSEDKATGATIEKHYGLLIKLGRKVVLPLVLTNGV